jgi:hypothetical protein
VRSCHYSRTWQTTTERYKDNSTQTHRSIRNSSAGTPLGKRHGFRALFVFQKSNSIICMIHLKAQTHWNANSYMGERKDKARGKRDVQKTNVTRSNHIHAVHPKIVENRKAITDGGETPTSYCSHISRLCATTTCSWIPDNHPHNQQIQCRKISANMSIGTLECLCAHL